MGTKTIKNSRNIYLLAFELILISMVFAGDYAGYVPLSKTPFLFLIAWASLRIRALTWKDAGLYWARKPWITLLIGVVAGLIFWTFEYFIENPVMHGITGHYADLTLFRDVVGNIKLLAIILILNLVLAAIGEELVWRGYALPRVATLFGNSTSSWLIAILAVNTVFGLAHLYQGTAGVVQASVQGALLGILYIYTGRNLLAPMAAHFVANTCDFVLVFNGTHVGLTP